MVFARVCVCVFGRRRTLVGVHDLPRCVRDGDDSSLIGDVEGFGQLRDRLDVDERAAHDLLDERVRLPKARLLLFVCGVR